jgi:hypothetical protein
MAKQAVQPKAEHGQFCAALGVRLFCLRLDFLPASTSERCRQSPSQMNPMIRKAFLATPIALLLGVGIYFYGGHTAPPTQPALVDLTPQTLSKIESAFNNAKDDVRVLVLLSPT